MTRRQTILGAISGSVALMRTVLAGDPWKKKSSEWRLEDARAILNHSPWALTGRVEFKINGKDVEGPRSGGVIGPPQGPPGGNGTIGPPGGGPARAGGGIKQNGPGVLPDFKVLVRWESALPVQIALGNASPTVRDNRHVLSVFGFPLLKNDIAGALSTLKGTTRLERNGGKEWLRPNRVISRESGEGVAIVFTFETESEPLTIEDREVLFVTVLGTMNLSVKFKLKDMLYDRKLAI